MKKSMWWMAGSESERLPSGAVIHDNNFLRGLRQSCGTGSWWRWPLFASICVCRRAKQLHCDDILFVFSSAQTAMSN